MFQVSRYNEQGPSHQKEVSLNRARIIKISTDILHSIRSSLYLHLLVRTLMKDFSNEPSVEIFKYSESILTNISLHHKMLEF